MGEIKVLDPLLHSNVSDGNFCQWEKTFLAVLSTSEKSEGQTSRSPDDQVFLSHNYLLMCQVAPFVN